MEHAPDFRNLGAALHKGPDASRATSSSGLPSALRAGFLLLIFFTAWRAAAFVHCLLSVLFGEVDSHSKNPSLYKVLRAWNVMLQAVIVTMMTMTMRVVQGGGDDGSGGGDGGNFVWCPNLMGSLV